MSFFICASCAGVRRTSEPRQHHCAGKGCHCGSCNQVVVAYNPSGLAQLQIMMQKVVPEKMLILGGFGLLNVAGALYSSFGFTAPVVWFGLLAGNIFYLTRVVRAFGR